MLINQLPFGGKNIGDSARAGADFTAGGRFGAEASAGLDVIVFRSGRGRAARRGDFNAQALRKRLRLSEANGGGNQQGEEKKSFHWLPRGTATFGCDLTCTGKSAYATQKQIR